MKRWLVVLGVLLGVAAAGFGGFALGHHQRAAASTTTSTTVSPTTTTAAAPTTSSSTSTTTASLVRCGAGAITVTAGQGQGAAGTISVPLQFANTGSTPCSLFGSPTVTLLAPSGQVAPTTVQVRSTTGFADAGANHAAAVVNLAVGGTAQVDLRYSDVPVGSARSCPTATGLAVAFPGWVPQQVTVTTTPCGGVIVTSPVFS